MTIKELIRELKQFDPNMEVLCSVDCDIRDEHDGRRVFGNGCRGVNPNGHEAVLLFDFDEANFDGPIVPSKSST